MASLSVYHDTPFIVLCTIFSIGWYDTASQTAFFDMFEPTSIELHQTVCMHITTLQLPRLIVQYLHILEKLSSEFDKILMCWVLAHVVVPIFFALEFDYETMCEGALSTKSAYKP